MTVAKSIEPCYRPPLLGCRDLCPVLGVSAEPLLADIDLTDVNCCDVLDNPWRDVRRKTLDWVIIGCESKGRKVGRLPGGTEAGYWQAAKSLIDQCRAAGVRVFHKQGAIDGMVSHSPAEWPEWARVQEWPKGKVTT